MNGALKRVTKTTTERGETWNELVGREDVDADGRKNAKEKLH